MSQTLKIGIIGNLQPTRVTHIATNDANRHAAGALSLGVEIGWLSTSHIEVAQDETMLSECDALWCAPGSPYASMTGALRAIHFAWERDRPFLGTWGDFSILC